MRRVALATLGRGIAEFKKATNELQTSLEREIRVEEDPAPNRIEVRGRQVWTGRSAP